MESDIEILSEAPASMQKRRMFRMGRTIDDREDEVLCCRLTLKMPLLIRFLFSFSWNFFVFRGTKVAESYVFLGILHGTMESEIVIFCLDCSIENL